MIRKEEGSGRVGGGGERIERERHLRWEVVGGGWRWWIGWRCGEGLGECVEKGGRGGRGWGGGRSGREKPARSVSIGLFEVSSYAKLWGSVFLSVSCFCLLFARIWSLKYLHCF